MQFSQVFRFFLQRPGKFLASFFFRSNFALGAPVEIGTSTLDSSPMMQLMTHQHTAAT
jgi:hypothetical protein